MSADRAVIHPEPTQLAGQTVVVALHGPGKPPVEYVVEDWWDRVHGGSWMWADGNPAATAFAIRRGMLSASGQLPMVLDDEVLYGHVGHTGHLVHLSEIVLTATATRATEAGA